MPTHLPTKTESVVVYSDLKSEAAGADLASQIRASFGDRIPDAVIVFASPVHDFPMLLSALTGDSPPKALVGCSSAGEFVTGAAGTGLACAVALISPDISFRAAVATNLAADRGRAAEQLLKGFAGGERPEFRYRSALVLSDALAGFTDELIEAMTLHTGGTYQFFGGGAGDDAQFRRTDVFCGTEVYRDAVVALEILSHKPVGLGVRHGWAPAGAVMRVTEVDGLRLVGLDGAPAVEAFEAHAAATGQRFDRSEPLPFFLHNVIGLQSFGDYKLRVPLAVNEDGSISCAADIPAGAMVSIMRSTAGSAAEAASAAAEDALAQLNGEKASVTLFFDCVATRLRLGDTFALELSALQRALGDGPFIGCNTHGQIVRSEHQFSGFHNCTAVVCVIPA
jgi:hypothetical protein